MVRMRKKRYRLTEEELEALVAKRAGMLAKTRNREYEWALLLEQADLRALQSQINPHFLYNTLECIRGMALMKDEEEIADIANALSHFFRYSISGKRDVVTLGEELDNVSSYCRIQKYRFSEKFQLRIDAAPAVGEILLPKLVLQPVVENAILHGLKDVTEGGLITVRAEPDGEMVRILISDNGCGMSPDALIALNRKISREAPEEESSGSDGRGTGIGMRNVNRRIKLFFGEEYGLAIRSCIGAGTDAELLIPGRLQEHETEGTDPHL